jgi:hypothetical protein
MAKGTYLISPGETNDTSANFKTESDYQDEKELKKKEC